MPNQERETQTKEAGKLTNAELLALILKASETAYGNDSLVGQNTLLQLYIAMTQSR